MTKVKICGLKSYQDISFVNELLPDYIGFVLAKSKRQIDFEQAKRLKRLLDDRIKAVGVFVNAEMVEICAFEGIIDLVQLHGDESEEYIARLKEACRMPIIKAIRVGANFNTKDLRETSADYSLFDTASKDAFGGTGEVFDWGKLEQPGSHMDLESCFLAGGICAGNALSAIETLRPYCLDVSSSVETDGRKDFEKIKSFIDIVRGKSARENSKVLGEMKEGKV